MKSKIITALLAVCIAVALWAYVITVENPESESVYHNVPVVFDGENVMQDRGMMITSDKEMTVTLKLSGKRSDLNNLKSSDMAAVLDLSRITEAGEKKMYYDVSIPGVTGVEVVSRQPDTLSLTVTEWASKEIPVELNYSGRVHEGYYVDKQSATLDSDKITVTGPKDVVSRIAMAKVTLDLEGRVETIAENLRYALCDAEGEPIEDVSSITTDRPELRVSVSIQQLKEVKLIYTVLEGGGLKASDVTITADYQAVTVAGSTAALLGLEEINLGEVDLGALTESTELVLPIELPEGVTNQSGFTVVRLQVQLPELEIREYTVSQFRTENVPQGHSAQIYTQVLMVKLRGRQPVLDRILPEHITAVADLTGMEAGVDSLPVEFDIQGFGNMENLGAVDKYFVTIRLVEGTGENADSQPGA